MLIFYDISPYFTMYEKKRANHTLKNANGAKWVDIIYQSDINLKKKKKGVDKMTALTEKIQSLAKPRVKGAFFRCQFRNYIVTHHKAVILA